MITLEDWEKHLAHMLHPSVSEIAIDTETTGIEGIKSGADYCMGVSFSYRLADFGIMDGYLPFRHADAENNLDKNLVLPALEHLLKSRPLVFHHRKFDLHSLKTLGITGLDKSSNLQYCTMVIAHMINEEWFSKELDYLSKMFLNDQKDKTELDKWVSMVGWAGVPSVIMDLYARHDTNLTLRLKEYLWPLLVKEELDSLWPVEQEYTNILFRMEQEAIKIDPEFIQQKLDRSDVVTGGIESILSFNPGSTKELGKFLLDELGLPVVKRTPAGSPSFNKEAMAEYDELLELQGSPFAKLILEYRGWSTFKSLFCVPMLKYKTPQDYIHTDYKQHGTVTTRLSSAKPNLQQIPRKSEKEWNGDAKKAFLAEEGFELIGYDYSQLEFRLAIAYGNDPFYVNLFNDPESDVFTGMSEKLNLKRQTCKHTTYCMLYGGGLEKAAATIAKLEELPTTDMALATAQYEEFKASMPGVNAASRRATSLAQQRGFIRLWTGRKRHLKYDFYRAFNSTLQGGAAELVKRSQIRCSKFEDENCKMVLQVHDEIVFKIRIGFRHIYEPLIVEAMTNWPDFGVRLKVEGKIWNQRGVED